LAKHTRHFIWRSMCFCVYLKHNSLCTYMKINVQIKIVEKMEHKWYIQYASSVSWIMI
jgi:hypothetical protein